MTNSRQTSGDTLQSVEGMEGGQGSENEGTWRVERTTATQQVIARLKEMIAAGHFNPGDKLPPERKLAELVGVSRPALREALQALSALRILNIRQGDGIYVS